MIINVKRIKLNRCEAEGCRRKATVIAANSESGKVGAFCEPCGDHFAERTNPEYTVNCPNCECHFGVN